MEEALARYEGSKLTEDIVKKMINDGIIHKNEVKPFAFLHNHTVFSIGDSTIKIRDLVKTAYLGQHSAVSINDHSTLGGAVKFLRCCNYYNVKPIIGSEVYVSHNNETFHLNLLAKSLKGYENLVAIVKDAYSNRKNAFKRPETTLEKISTHKDDLFCLTACIGGFVARLGMLGLNILKEIFDKDNLFIEVIPSNEARVLEQTKTIIDVAMKSKVPVILTPDAHMVSPSKANIEARNMYRKIVFRHKSSKQIQDTIGVYSLNSINGFANYCRKCFPQINIEKCFKQSHEISEMVECYDIPPCIPEIEGNLLELAVNSERYKHGNDRLKQQVKYEIKVIEDLNFSQYILLVNDIIKFIKDNNIGTNPARGSSGASTLCYVLGITDINPLKHNLIFERFVNPGRKFSPPDIDIDVDEFERDRVAEYILNKYPSYRIRNYVFLHGRGVLRDILRIKNFSEEKINEATQLIELGSNTIPNKVKVLYPNEVEIAKILVGCIRAKSQHAGGWIILSDNRFIPADKQYSEYDMEDIDNIGSIKVDVLASSHAALIHRLAKQTNTKLSDISLEDTRIAESFARGNTEGIFQLNTSLSKKILSRVKPKTFDEVCHTTALGRPGVMHYLDRYIKNTPVKLEECKDILNETRGVVLFQEQIIQIASVLGDLTLEEADILRRAIAKQKDAKTLFERFRKRVNEKMLARYGESGAERATDDIMKFIKNMAGYSFNKAHAYSYTYVAWYEMFYRLYYPKHFLNEQLNMFITKKETLSPSMKKETHRNKKHC